MDLTGRNILFFSPNFFGIEKVIINELKNMNANVFSFDERPNLSSFSRAVNSILPGIFKGKSYKYYKKIIDSVKNEKIDTILIVKGDQVSLKTLNLFRETFKDAKIILYLWDPISCIKGIDKMLKHYDEVISFDSEDCKKYGFRFRPLFIDVEREKNNSEKKYDVCFFGTIYGDRPKVLNYIEKYCNDNNLKYYGFYFLRGKFMYLYYYLTKKAFRKINKNNISYKPLSQKEIANLIDSSKVVLDINERLQSGLTMRTLETVGIGKKMISTNNCLKEYDFYNENNILTIDRDNIEIDKSFFDKEYVEIDKDIVKNYTARGWIDEVFK